MSNMRHCGEAGADRKALAPVQSVRHSSGNTLAAKRPSLYSCRPCLRRPRCTCGASAVQLNIYRSLIIIELVMLSVSTQFIYDIELLRRELSAVLLI
jgi:hypothetical protein